MFKKLSGVGFVVALLAASALIPAQANAADGCGDGWYKYRDGYMTRDQQWPGSNNRNAWIYHSGRMRACTDNDTFNDDERRKVLIGYPSDSYPFQSQVFKNGNYNSFCVSQRIKVNMSGIKSSTSWTLGGSISKDDAGVEWSYSATYDTITVEFPGARVCDPDKSQLIARTSGITATADNETGHIEWVELHTTISGSYTVSGSKIGFSHTLIERDYADK